MSSPPLKVLIVGASIAGPTAAYWFAKAGAHVTIIERFPSLRINGQGIDIRTAGVTVMRKMPGMEAAVRAKSTQLEGISFVRENVNARPYGIIRATGNPDQQSLVSEYEIYRGDLAKILYDLTKENENIKYVFGEQVTSISNSDIVKEGEDGPVTVEFANGFPTSKYDLVVACDGATSRTRAIGLGCGVRDHVFPINSWAAFFSIEQDLVNGSKIGQAFSAPGGRFVALGRDRATLMGIHPRDDHDAILPFREAMKKGDDALKGFVAQHYHGAGWKTDGIIKGMMPSEDFYANEIVQVKPPSLYRRRFVLVGDAGYAPGPTGGGTTLALAGAYVLAGEVGKHKNDLAAALAGYEKTMRPIIDELQKIPPGVPGIMAPQTRWGIWLRNHIFAFIAWSRVLNFAQKFFAGAFASSEKYPLPEYEWVA
ncbi:oxidoreductase [Stipitochalara longipes BDJ]|nr:oxidoreductase [Stipitochalara longipes BDJ]